MNIHIFVTFFSSLTLSLSLLELVVKHSLFSGHRQTCGSRPSSLLLSSLISHLFIYSYFSFSFFHFCVSFILIWSPFAPDKKAILFLNIIRFRMVVSFSKSKNRKIFSIMAHSISSQDFLSLCVYLYVYPLVLSRTVCARSKSNSSCFL